MKHVIHLFWNQAVKSDSEGPNLCTKFKIKNHEKTSSRNNLVSFSLVVGAFHPPPPLFFNVAKCAAWHPEFECSKLKCFHRSLDFFTAELQATKGCYKKKVERVMIFSFCIKKKQTSDRSVFQEHIFLRVCTTLWCCAMYGTKYQFNFCINPYTKVSNDLQFFLILNSGCWE